MRPNLNFDSLLVVFSTFRIVIDIIYAFVPIDTLIEFASFYE